MKSGDCRCFQSIPKDCVAHHTVFDFNHVGSGDDWAPIAGHPIERFRGRRQRCECMHHEGLSLAKSAQISYRPPPGPPPPPAPPARAGYALSRHSSFYERSPCCTTPRCQVPPVKIRSSPAPCPRPAPPARGIVVERTPAFALRERFGVCVWAATGNALASPTPSTPMLTWVHRMPPQRRSEKAIRRGQSFKHRTDRPRLLPLLSALRSVLTVVKYRRAEEVPVMAVDVQK